MKKRSLILVLTLLLLMSSPLVHDEDPWQYDGIMVEPHQISESEEAITDERAPSLCRSSRLAGKGNIPDTPSIDDWPIPKLLEFLFNNDVTALVRASHQELFALFLNCAGFPPVNQRPVSTPRKASAKRKHCSQNSVVAPTPAAAPPAKKARPPTSAVASTAPANDAILAALSSIQSSLSSMNSRIQTLETAAASSSSSALQSTEFTSREPAASSSTQASDVILAPLDDITIPRRPLGSAVPISTGVPFYPPAAAISCNLRSQILAGNDVTVPFRFHSSTIDPNGRFIILSGHINHFPITLVNIYGPNMDDPGFFRKMFDMISDDDLNHILIGGDFNCYLDPHLDRLSSAPAPNIVAAQTPNNLMKSKKVVDIWRVQHPSDRDYSFYSHVHKSYTRIDYFLVDSRLISDIDHTQYHNIIISDHSPVSLNLHLSLPGKIYNWRFNPSLLADQAFKEYIKTHILQFLETNDSGEVNDSILWETLKVYIRGHIISYEAKLKRAKRERLEMIEKELPAAERAYRNTLLQSDYNNILKLKYEYNQILSEQVGNLLLKLKQRHFELGDKPQSLLARQLKGEQTD